MTIDKLQALLIFFAVMCGVLSAGYMYQSVVGIFFPALRKALRYIALGMVSFTVGVFLAAMIVFSSQLGLTSIAPYENALSAGFYILYIIGSILIVIGARQFAFRPAKKVADVSLQQI